MCGVALAIGDREAIGITPNEIRIKTASDATLALYRKPEIDYRVAYEAHLKSTSEEAHLRALERTFFLFRSNNPNASVDDAKAAVLAAIGARAP